MDVRVPCLLGNPGLPGSCPPGVFRPAMEATMGHRLEPCRYVLVSARLICESSACPVETIVEFRLKQLVEFRRISKGATYLQTNTMNCRTIGASHTISTVPLGGSRELRLDCRKLWLAAAAAAPSPARLFLTAGFLPFWDRLD